MNTQVHETIKQMAYELVLDQPPRSIIIPEPQFKGTINEQQLDEKDAEMYKIDNEVVKEEKCNSSDEKSAMMCNEELKQETYNEKGKNELQKF